MKEIEIKLKYSNEKDLRDKLKAVKGKPKETYEIIDCYYGKKGETMKTAENILRIRTKKGVSELTFKGKKETDSDVWERVEINVLVGDHEKMELILKSLGFKRILKNRTLREYWDIEGTELGIMKILEPASVDFVEIEGKTKTEVEKITKLFTGVLQPIDKDHFRKLDEANK
ncbi:MAG: CYTH domain-containing protein [Nanoarchaeota archaeon]